MTQTLQLSNGDTATFSHEDIQISDSYAKRLFWVNIISYVTMIPLHFLILSQQNYDYSDPVTWFFTIAIPVLLITIAVKLVRNNWQKTVALDEVESAQVETSLWHAKLILKLKNGKRREILGKRAKAKEFRAYIEANLKRR